jgi:hypothetical protein
MLNSSEMKAIKKNSKIEHAKAQTRKRTGAITS